MSAAPPNTENCIEHFFRSSIVQERTVVTVLFPVPSFFQKTSFQWKNNFAFVLYVCIRIFIYTVLNNKIRSRVSLEIQCKLSLQSNFLVPMCTLLCKMRIMFTGGGIQFYSDFLSKKKEKDYVLHSLKGLAQFIDSVITIIK